MEQKQPILIVGQSNLASTTGGAITVLRQFSAMLSGNGYQVLVTWYSNSPQKPNWDIPGVSFRSVVPSKDAINSLVEESNPCLIVFFFPALYLDAHLKKQFASIPRILMFHSRPDYYFATFKGLEHRLKKYYINTHAQILLESFRPLLPSYIRKGPVSVIPNGVKSPSVKADLSVEHRKMVYFSRLDPNKGADLAIEAMATVKDRYPNWQLDIFGDFEPASYRDTLQQLIKEKGVDNQVYLMGLSKRSAQDTLAEYDFCVFPSRFEGFSLGLAEAMASGLPCIGLNNASGVNECIVDGYNGLLCQDSPLALADSIIHLIEHPDKRREMGNNAAGWALQFNPEAIQAQWMTLIYRILHKDSHSILPVKELVK